MRSTSPGAFLHTNLDFESRLEFVCHDKPKHVLSIRTTFNAFDDYQH